MGRRPYFGKTQGIDWNQLWRFRVVHGMPWAMLERYTGLSRPTLEGGIRLWAAEHGYYQRHEEYAASLLY